MAGEPLYSEFADDEDMAELLVEFVAGLKTNCERLEKALEAGDLEVIRRTGHQLKGAGGGYGFPLITELGGKLESAVQADKAVTDTVRSRAHDLLMACSRATAESPS